MNKKPIKIAVTDSGLGGLSVFAHLAKFISEKKNFPDCDLVFFNAIPYSGFGYNLLSSNQEKALVFNEVLTGIEEHFNPDLIIIACNTLSVIYPDTHFANTTITEVLDIVQFGVQDILTVLNSEPKSNALLLGTPTTIFSDIHKKLLIKEGIQSSRIYTVPCPKLESVIQLDPTSEKTKDSIKTCLSEVINKEFQSREKVYAGLFCTHYSYAKYLFKEIFDEFNINSELIDPNISMVGL
jgi:glutamate racemase